MTSTTKDDCSFGVHDALGAWDARDLIVFVIMMLMLTVLEARYMGMIERKGSLMVYMLLMTGMVLMMSNDVQRCRMMPMMCGMPTMPSLAHNGHDVQDADDAP